MCLSFDHCHLFTAGADGCLMVFEVRDSEGRNSRREKEGYGLPYAEEILVSKAQIEELSNDISSLLNIGREQEANNRQQLEMAIQDKQEEISKLQKQIAQETEQERVRYQHLLHNKDQAELIHRQEIKTITELFEQETNDFRQNLQLKLDKEEQRYQELANQKELNTQQHTKHIEDMKDKHTRALTERQEMFKQETEDINHLLEALHTENKTLQTQFDQRRKQIDFTCEKEVFELKQRNHRETEELNKEVDESTARLKLAKQVKNQRKNENHIKSNEVEGIDAELDRQREVIKQLNEELATARKEINVRNQTIKDKTSRKNDHLKKKQELKKFKFILKHKFKELKKQKVPRNLEIARLSEQTGEMEKETKHLYSVNETLAVLVQNLEMKQKGMTHELTNQRDTLYRNNNKIQGYKDNIYEAVQYLQDEKRLKESILKLYENFTRNDAQTKPVSSDRGYVRQCNHLENTLASLRKKENKTQKLHQQYLNRIMNQNVELTKEINGLKKELKHLDFLKSQIDALTHKNRKNPAADSELKREIGIPKGGEIHSLTRRIDELGS